VAAAAAMKYGFEQEMRRIIVALDRELAVLNG
jgi:hypothetical protein